MAGRTSNRRLRIGVGRLLACVHAYQYRDQSDYGKLVSVMGRIRPKLILLSSCVVVGSFLFLVGMLLWAYRLDADFSAKYDCCTQEAVAAFHRSFWLKFFTVATLGLIGCLGLAVTLRNKHSLIFGLLLIVASPALFLISLGLGADWEGWSGATALSSSFALLCAGASVLALSGVRVGWPKLQSRLR